MSARPFNVLFLCTGNSARSIIAEALLRDLAGQRYGAFSAGSRPLGTVNPLALEVLRRAGIDTGGLRSKGLGAFEGSDAPALDLVITVCAAAAADCPLWPGAPALGHWRLSDPAAVTGSETARRRAFEATASALRERVTALVALLDRRPGSAAALGRAVSAVDEDPSACVPEPRHG